MADGPKACPTCGKRYGAAVLFCPADGAPLARRAKNQGEDPFVGLVVDGHFELRRLVGIGAMARVYHAFQAEIDRDVAVKILHAELCGDATVRGRFQREARVAGRLRHPNVVHVILAGTLPGDGRTDQPYLALEYLDGMSLASALAGAGGSLSLERTLHIVVQVCDAIGEAHARGVVHRDLKPENIMLVTRGADADFVKVLDFGMARADFVSDDVSTRAGSVLGTARYMSPEGARGAPVGPSSDVYSIATLMFQCLSGRTPFDGQNPITVLIQHTRDEPPSLHAIAPSVPEPLADLVHANLSKDPEARSSDARAFGCALLAAVERSGLGVDPLRRATLARAGAPAPAASSGTTRRYELSEETRARLGEVGVTKVSADDGGAGGRLARGLRRLIPALIAVTFGAPARAKGIDSVDHLRPERDEANETWGMAEFGIGLLTLPTAEVCVDREAAGCSKGDGSLSLSAWPLFRRDQFAIGAGVTLGLTPTADAPRNENPNLAHLDRDHSRSYYTFEITGRYYVPLNETLDGWIGASTGLVVVNDTFQTKNGLTERALVGPRGVTILTEGATIGASAGVAYAFAENWLFGGALRVSNWFLPNQPARDPIGDEASLDGNVLTVDLGINLAYRSRFIF